MFMRTLLIALLALVLPLSAQEQRQEQRKPEARTEAVPKAEEAGRAYKLNYVISEFDAGKRTDSKEYSMVLEGSRVGRVRVGTRVPILRFANKPEEPPSVQYIDIGVNIDANTRHVSDSAVWVRSNLNVSSVIAPTGEADKTKATSLQPVIRNFSSENEVTVPVGKPVVLFVLDEPNSRRSFQVQVTATRVR